MQQRVILAALCWVDADSAVDENVGLAKLHRPCARCLVQRRLQRVLAGKLSRFSCACTVGDRDAACEGKALSREVSVTDAVAVGGSRCKSEVEGEPGCHRRSCAARGHTLALSFRRSRLGSQHLRLDPLACSAFSKRTEDDLRLIEGRCFVGDGLSRFEVDTSRACTTVALTWHTPFAGCVSLVTLIGTSAGQRRRTSISRSHRSKVPWFLKRNKQHSGLVTCERHVKR